MIETAGADVHAAAATTDTDHAAPLTNATAGDRRAPENPVDACMEEEEAGVGRTTDTGRGPGESREEDLDHAPSLRPHEKTSTQRQLRITPRRKCDGHTPRPAPGPGRRHDRAPVPALGPDPGPDASQEDVRKVSAPALIRHFVRWTSWSFVKKRCLF